jgi:acyl-CoA thioesterase-2
MSNALEKLVTLLSLERIEENLFRGQSQDLGWGTVFGGQVLGQALAAATHTVAPDRHVHSLHAYFLRPGDVSKPIVYDVDRIRDGTSFVTRRVVAIQAGRPIFNLAASFHRQEDGFAHQDAMPEAPPPDGLVSEQERARVWAKGLPPPLRAKATGPRPFEHRPVEPEPDPIAPETRPPHRKVWLRATQSLADNPALHAYLLAYASDHGFLSTSLLPHGVSWLSPGMQVASIDHVMWFHRQPRVDDWLLYVVDSPVAAGARGFVRGQIFAPDGTLVVSTAQEGLIRRRDVTAAP